MDFVLPKQVGSDISKIYSCRSHSSCLKEIKSNNSEMRPSRMNKRISFTYGWVIARKNSILVRQIILYNKYNNDLFLEFC